MKTKTNGQKKKNVKRTKTQTRRKINKGMGTNESKIKIWKLSKESQEKNEQEKEENLEKERQERKKENKKRSRKKKSNNDKLTSLHPGLSINSRLLACNGWPALTGFKITISPSTT